MGLGNQLMVWATEQDKRRSAPSSRSGYDTEQDNDTTCASFRSKRYASGLIPGDDNSAIGSFDGASSSSSENSHHGMFETSSEKINILNNNRKNFDSISEIGVDIDNLMEAYKDENNIASGNSDGEDDFLMKDHRRLPKRRKSIDTVVTTGFFHDKFIEKTASAGEKSELFNRQNLQFPEFGKMLDELYAFFENSNYINTSSDKTIHLQSFVLGMAVTIVGFFLKPLIVSWVGWFLYVTYQLFKHVAFWSTVAGVAYLGYKAFIVINKLNSDTKTNSSAVKFASSNTRQGHSPSSIGNDKAHPIGKIPSPSNKHRPSPKPMFTAVLRNTQDIQQTKTEAPKKRDLNVTANELRLLRELVTAKKGGQSLSNTTESMRMSAPNGARRPPDSMKISQQSRQQTSTGNILKKEGYDENHCEALSSRPSSRPSSRSRSPRRSLNKERLYDYADSVTETCTIDQSSTNAKFLLLQSPFSTTKSPLRKAPNSRTRSSSPVRNIMPSNGRSVSPMKNTRSGTDRSASPMRKLPVPHHAEAKSRQDSVIDMNSFNDDTDSVISRSPSNITGKSYTSSKYTDNTNLSTDNFFINNNNSPSRNNDFSDTASVTTRGSNFSRYSGITNLSSESAESGYSRANTILGSKGNYNKFVRNATTGPRVA
ncbi:hypothetical protein DASC09_026360 [Saccharomycopsis crataegensis]|uniref:Uncharacterized protein n=1 Tax=Saccharomycopsis crataegensis TaxID=43959 RepID=A0AAV5QL58_9ASCO|nr:hypothetical protein DASC09_026360 [Saccharomycopsis crataegensis]